jgi:hypothetical protein
MSFEKHGVIGQGQEAVLGGGVKVTRDRLVARLDVYIQNEAFPKWSIPMAIQSGSAKTSVHIKASEKTEWLPPLTRPWCDPGGYLPEGPSISFDRLSCFDDFQEGLLYSLEESPFVYQIKCTAPRENGTALDFLLYTTTHAGACCTHITKNSSGRVRLGGLKSRSSPSVSIGHAFTHAGIDVGGTGDAKYAQFFALIKNHKLAGVAHARGRCYRLLGVALDIPASIWPYVDPIPS